MQLGTVDWNQVASAASAIGTGVQTGANAYTSVVNAVNASKNPSRNQNVQQILNQAAGAGGSPEPKKDNTMLYVAIGGVGLLAVGGILFAVLRKRK